MTSLTPISIQKIDAITLKHLASELDRMLIGARVSKIVHPHTKEFLITFWGHAPDDASVANRIPRGELNQFYINLHPEFCYAFLLAKNERERVIKTSLHQPTSVCMLLRKHLGNAKLLGVSTLPDERVLNLRFENFNELGNKVILVLSLELMGKHSNMILYDEVTDDVLAISHSVSEKMSQYRELTVGSSYAPPPMDPRKHGLQQLTEYEFLSLLTASPLEIEAFVDFTVDHIAGLGKSMVRQAVETTLGENPLNPDSAKAFKSALYKKLQGVQRYQSIAPTLDQERQQFSLTPVQLGEPFHLVHELLRAYFIPLTEERRLEAYKKQLAGAVTSIEKKRLKREQTLTPMSLAEIEALQETGHLLLTHGSSSETKKPLKAVVTIENFDGETSSIDVDPNLSWTENAEQYYRRAKKAKARQEQLTLQQDALANEKRFYDELSLMVQQADQITTLLQLEEDLSRQLRLKMPATKQKNNPGNTARQTATTAGILSLKLQADENEYSILIGRTAQANGDIVSRLSRPNDWWLHVANMPGSHVLVKAEHSDNVLPDAILWQAANLAVYFSAGRESKNVPVVYTAVRHVRKIPSSYPGHVTYKQEQTVFISVDKPMIDGLLAGVSKGKM